MLGESSLSSGWARTGVTSRSPMEGISSRLSKLSGMREMSPTRMIVPLSPTAMSPAAARFATSMRFLRCRASCSVSSDPSWARYWSPDVLGRHRSRARETFSS